MTEKKTGRKKAATKKTTKKATIEKSRAKPETLMTRNVTGAGGTRIRRDMYDLFRRAILAACPRAKKGIAFRDLVAKVAERLGRHEFSAKGSVTWYTVTIKLDLEARGEIERIPRVTPQHLRRIG